MPYTPQVDDVSVSRTLGTFAVSYAQKIERDFVALQAARRVKVRKKLGKYFKWDRASENRLVMRQMGALEEVPTGTQAVTTADYECLKYGIGRDIDLDSEANQDPEIKLLERATNYCVRQAHFRLEQNFADTCMVSSAWSNSKTGHASTQSSTNFIFWDDDSSSFLDNIFDAKPVVKKASGGYEPNTLILGYEVYQTLKTHPQIKDATKYTSADSITREMIARQCEVDRVLVMGGVLNSAQKGQTENNAFIGGDDALLCYVNPNEPAISEDENTAMLTMVWIGNDGEFTDLEGFLPKEEQIPLKDGKRVSLKLFSTIEIIDAGCGFYFDDCLT